MIVSPDSVPVQPDCSGRNARRNVTMGFSGKTVVKSIQKNILYYILFVVYNYFEYNILIQWFLDTPSYHIFSFLLTDVHVKMTLFVMLSTELVHAWMGGMGRIVTFLVLVVSMAKDVCTVVVSNQLRLARSVTRKKEHRHVLQDIVVPIVNLGVILFGTVKNVFHDVLVSKRTHRSVTHKKDSVFASRVFVDKSM